MSTRRAAVIVAIAALAVRAERVEGDLASQGSQFRAGVELVEVIAVVTDEQGRPVADLTPEDFQVLEEGRPQTISVFQQVTVPVPRASDAAVPRGRTSTTQVAANDVLPEGRVFALILDDQLTQPVRTMAVRRLARQFVEEYAGPSDLIGVFSTGGRAVLTQEFTTDHQRVLRAVDRFHGNRVRNAERDPERIYSYRVAMDVIAKLADHLSGVRGRRVTALWFSEGIEYDLSQPMRPSGLGGAPLGLLTMSEITRETAAGPEPTAVIRAVQEAMDALARANVVLYSVDPRGLYGLEGELTEYKDAPGAPPKPDPAELARSILNLRTVAERTGGFAAVNTNDFGEPFRRIVQESSAYYVLGYSPTRRGRPGEYRRITVRTRPGLRVSARPGYVVPPPRNQPTASPVMAALDDSLPRPQLPMRVQAVPLPGNGGGDSLAPVQVIVEVDGSGLSFAPDDGSHVERLEIALKTVDDLARETNRTSAETTLRLTEAERDRAVRDGVRWMTTITLPAGHHSLRGAAHAATAGRTGSVFVDVDVPRVGPDDGWVSDLVVTSTAAAAALTGGSPSILPLPGPPTTTRRFRRGDALAFAAALRPAGDDAGAVRVSVARLDASGETAIADHVLDRQPSPRGGEYVSFALPTSGLAPGRYVVRLSAATPEPDQPPAGGVLEFEVVP